MSEAVSRACLDASVAIAFAFVDEPLHAPARALVASLSAQNVRLCAPQLFVYECDSIILLRVHRGASSDEQAQEARAIIAALSVSIEGGGQVEADRAFALATEYAQPRVYDATYAAFCEVRGVEFHTADKPFFEALNGSKRPKAARPLAFVTLLR